MEIAPVCQNITTREKLLQAQEQQAKAVELRNEAVEAEADQFDSWLWGWRPGGLVRQDNGARLVIAKKYLQLYLLSPETNYLEKALTLLDEGLKTYDVLVEPQKVLMYFELALQKAETLLLVDQLRVITYLETVRQQLADSEFYKTQGENEITVSGYLQRANFIQARALTGLGRRPEAAQLFEEVIAYTTLRTRESSLTLLLQNQEREKIEYLAAAARRQLAFIQLEQGEEDKAAANLLQILSWEPSGSGQKAYLDLAYAALVGCLLIGDHRGQPNWFNTALPWEKINNYQALKKALGLSNNLSDSRLDKRMLFLRAFSSPASDLDDQLKYLVSAIRLQSKLAVDKFNPEAIADPAVIKQIIEAIVFNNSGKAVDYENYFAAAEEFFQQRPDLLIVRQSAPQVLPYFLDSRQYWNNTISLLGRYAAEALKNQQSAEALLLIAALRRRLEQQARYDRCLLKSYAPDSYHLAMLDLIEAELLAQSKNLHQLEQGIVMVGRALDTCLASAERPRQPAAPDYYAVARGKLILADLYQQKGNITGNREELERAAKIYQGLSEPEKPTVEAALEQNRRRGYLSAQDSNRARHGIFLTIRGIAQIKLTALSLILGQNNTLEKIKARLAGLKEGVRELQQAGPAEEYYFLLAQLLEGELLLARASLAPLAEEENIVRTTILLWEDQRYSGYPYFQAWANLKRAEVAIRLAEHAQANRGKIGGAADIVNLLQTTQQVFSSTEYLGIERDYLLLVAQLFLGRPGDYPQLLAMAAVLKINVGRSNLNEGLKAYFNLLADLKIAEIKARQVAARNRQQFTAVIRLFDDLLKKLEQLVGYRQELQIDLNSLYAEYYFERYRLEKNRQWGKLAYQYCLQSRSRYDREERIKQLLNWGIRP